MNKRQIVMYIAFQPNSEKMNKSGEYEIKGNVFFTKKEAKEFLKTHKGWIIKTFSYNLNDIKTLAPKFLIDKIEEWEE